MHWIEGSHLVWTWIGWIGILFLAVCLALWAVRVGLASSGAAPEPPEEVLRRRYANGEMDRTEYERRLADLER